MMRGPGSRHAPVSYFNPTQACATTLTRVDDVSHDARPLLAPHFRIVLQAHDEVRDVAAGDGPVRRSGVQQIGGMRLVRWVDRAWRPADQADLVGEGAERACELAANDAARAEDGLHGCS